MGDRDETRPGPEPLARTPLEFVSGGRDAMGRSGSDELCLPASTSSARTARHWVMNELAAEGVFGAENQIVELLTGELVANAALHGPAQGLIRVRVGRAGWVVRVAVRDDSSTVPVVRHPEPTAANGRGLELVDSLATAWGIDHHDDGKTVWFSVDLDPT
ncbi:MAG: ATP-binding protein [Cellulomonas sp.]